MTSRALCPRLWLAPLFVGCATGFARAQATTPKRAPTVTFEAELARATVTAHGVIKAGGVSFTCGTTHCTGKGSGNDPSSICAALVKQVGRLKSFTAAGKSVDMKACNGVTPAMSLVPSARPANTRFSSSA